jgi:hypothetical protein
VPWSRSRRWPGGHHPPPQIVVAPRRLRRMPSQTLNKECRLLFPGQMTSAKVSRSRRRARARPELDVTIVRRRSPYNPLLPRNARFYGRATRASGPLKGIVIQHFVRAHNPDRARRGTGAGSRVSRSRLRRAPTVSQPRIGSRCSAASRPAPRSRIRLEGRESV